MKQQMRVNMQSFKASWLFLVFAVMLATEAQGFSQTAGYIYTVGGDGIGGFSGDGSAATSAEIYAPVQNIVDSSGNIYFVDYGNERIRKITHSTGNISTVAGTGVTGFSGDGGSGSSAKIWYPEQLALDTSGNLYFADSYNNAIRKVDASTGIISTVVFDNNGCGPTNYVCLPYGVAVDSSGNIYYSNSQKKEVYKYDISSNAFSVIAGGGSPATGNGDGGLATNAKLTEAAAIGLDGLGNLYIQDNGEIRKVNLSTGTISSADTAYSTASYYFGAVDPSGNIYMYGNNQIIELTASGGVVNIAGTGAAGYNGDGQIATNAELGSMTNALEPIVGVDSSGNVYISDGANNRIREVISTSRSPKYRPSVYDDQGTDDPSIYDGWDPSSNPAGPTMGSSATVNGAVEYVYQGGGFYDVYVLNGSCVWSGFPSHTDSSNLTLRLPYSAFFNGGSSAGYPYVTVTATIGGSSVNIYQGFMTNATGTWTANVPAGTNLNTINVSVIVDEPWDGDNYDPANHVQNESLTVDMYVQ